jgi:SAM-dependent methyltransferase
MTRPLANAFGELYATDVSGEMIRQARQHLQGLSNVRLYETNGLDLAELPSDHFDIVFSAYVFQHVPSVEVIRANLLEAYRVLKPGGTLKFQTNSIRTFDFEEIEKDTWIGASLPEAEIRSLSAETGAQLISICGAGTQYCWTTMRKRPRAANAPQYAVTRPRIELFSRADNPQIKEVPVTGDDASLALIVSGLIRDEVDANSLSVEINDQEVLPHYVGPLSPRFAEALKAARISSPGDLTQVEVSIPIGEPSGRAQVRARLGRDSASPLLSVELCELQPVIPQIGTIVNASDQGTDIYAYGVKSSLRLYVEGLDETADPGNVRVQVGEKIIKPSYVGFLPRQGAYQVDAQLPQDIKPGVTEVRLYFGNLQSPSRSLHIRS